MSTEQDLVKHLDEVNLVVEEYLTNMGLINQAKVE